MLHIIGHGVFREGRIDIGQVLRLTGDDADVGVVALVATAGPSQFDQWHSHFAGSDVASAVIRQDVGIKRASGRNVHRYGVAVQVHSHRNRLLADQGGEQANARERLGASANQAGQARCHAGGGLGNFPGKQTQGFLVIVQRADLDHYFAGVATTGLSAIGGFAAKDFHAGLAHGRHAQLFEQAVHLFQDGVGHHLAFLRGVDTAHQEGGSDTVTIRVGGGDLITVGGRQAPGAADTHPVVAHLFQLYLGKVADHVGQHIGTRIANFIDDLFAYGGGVDQATGVVRLGNDEVTVRKTLGNGKAHVVEVRNIAPVGEVAAGALGAAFDHMAGQ